MEESKVLNYVTAGLLALVGGVGAYQLGKNNVDTTPLAGQTQTVPVASVAVVDAQAVKEKLAKAQRDALVEAQMTHEAKQRELAAAEKNLAKASKQVNEIKQALNAQLTAPKSAPSLQVATLSDSDLVKPTTAADKQYVAALGKLTDKTQAGVKPEATDRYNKVNVADQKTAEGQGDIASQLDVAVKRVMALQAKLDKLEKKLEAKNSEGGNYQSQLKQEVAVRQNEMRTIVVKAGDNLWNIAKRAYGNGFEYKKIYAANPEIGKNPDLIAIGQKLRVPV